MTFCLHLGTFSGGGRIPLAKQGSVWPMNSSRGLPGNLCGTKHWRSSPTTLTENDVSLANKGFSCAPQRQEFACAKILLDSMETRNSVQATLF